MNYGKIYQIIRTGAGRPIVTVYGKTIEPGRSQQLYNHSPDGFEFGYGGSGPAQLALAILLDYTNDRKLALKLHQDFKWTFISSMKREGGQINASEIDEFLARYKNKEAV